MASASTGCILPFPHVKQTCGEIQGHVVDAKTKLPIQQAKVSVCYPDGDDRSTSTDAGGNFHFGSKYRFHYAVVIGIALNYSVPYDMGWNDFSVITIDAPGYQSICFYPRDGRLGYRSPHVKPLPLLDPYSVVDPLATTNRGTSSAMDSDTNWEYPAIEMHLAADSDGDMPRLNPIDKAPGRRQAEGLK